MSVPPPRFGDDYLGAIGRPGVCLSAIAALLLVLALGTDTRTLGLPPASAVPLVACRGAGAARCACHHLVGEPAALAVGGSARKAALESRQQLIETIEAIPMGLGLYDREGRMVLFNARLAEVNPDIYTPDIIGLHYGEIIDRLVQWRPIERGDREEVRQLLTERFHRQAPGNVQATPDGRFIESNEIHTPSGYIASCRVDITALKRREQELEVSEARYRHVVESMLDAVFTTDAWRRLCQPGGRARAGRGGGKDHRRLGEAAVSPRRRRR